MKPRTGQRAGAYYLRGLPLCRSEGYGPALAGTAAQQNEGLGAHVPLLRLLVLFVRAEGSGVLIWLRGL